MKMKFSQKIKKMSLPPSQNKKISVIISEPIITKGMEINDKDLLLQNCRNVIENNLKHLKQNHKVEFELHSVR